MNSLDDRDALTPSPAAAAAVIDVFVYVVVLNLFVEYLPAVVSETFTLSLLTAILLKAVLEAVVAAKKRIAARLRSAGTPMGKAAAALSLWAVMIGSKFAVLEITHRIFGDRVRLGGFFAVSGLIIVLLSARFAMRRLLRAVGRSAGPGP